MFKGLQQTAAIVCSGPTGAWLFRKYIARSRVDDPKLQRSALERRSKGEL